MGLHWQGELYIYERKICLEKIITNLRLTLIINLSTPIYLFCDEYVTSM